MNLFPDFASPDVSEKAEVQTQNLKTALWDFEKGDFATDKSNKVLLADEGQAFEQWCIKAVATQRSAFLAYGDNYGTEREEAFSEPTRAAQESAFERYITESLLADPYERTSYVKDFSFGWKADGLTISFTVGAKNGIQYPLSVTL
jgi:hypothetical protein